MKIGNNQIYETAFELRRIAKDFENIQNDVFLKLERIDVRWVGGPQDPIGKANVHIGRFGFTLELIDRKYVKNNLQKIFFRWEDSIGSLPHEFKIYLRDHSFIELVPSEKKTQLLLSAFWQVFHEGLNGLYILFQNPIESNFGSRLREVSNYIAENMSSFSNAMSVRIEEIPTRLKKNELAGLMVSHYPVVGEKIERWKLIDRLGGGAFGQVFRAQNVDSGELSAIKLMSPVDPNGVEISVHGKAFHHYQENFLDEADLSIKVSSPFAVSAVDCGAEPWPWIRYPLVVGEGIIDGFQKSKDKSSEWWNLAHDLLSALNTIHLEGLLHKDIKPDNMLRTQDCYVLVDFGIGEVSGYSELVNPSRIGGTFGFMAPELLLRHEPNYHVGFEIDIFSAGMTLLTLLDSGPRFELAKSQKLSFQSGSAEPLSQYMRKPINLDGVPLETRTLLASMLNYDPAMRPTANNLLKQVIKFVDLNQKLKLIQAHKENRIIQLERAETAGMENRFIERLTGPLFSWMSIENLVHHVIEDIRPYNFVITINPDDEEDIVYVQALSGGGGWHLEAMSETFSLTRQSNQVKQKLLQMNWTPPSASEPNFSMNLSKPNTSQIVDTLMKAFEFGYGISPTQIRVLEITAQGAGTY